MNPPAFQAHKLCSSIFLAALALAAPLLPAKDPVDYVDPFIGAASTRPTKVELAKLTAEGVKLDPKFDGFHGKLFPGACTPFGMVQLSPDTITGGDNGAGYSFPHPTIQGFSINHMSGVGAYGDLGNFMVMPTTGPLKTWYGETGQPGSGYLSSYSKKNEVAQAGYYAVTLDDYHVRTELTAAPHSGILRFTFPKNPQSRIQIDLARRIGGTSLHQTVKVVNDHAIEGEIECTNQMGGFRGGTVTYTLYYHAEFSRPLKDYGVWSATIPDVKNVWKTPEFATACAAAEVLPGCREKEGRHLGFFANFATKDQDTILLKVGISYVDLAGARQNLQTEIPAWDFDRVRQEARASWEKELSRMAVAGGTEDQKTIFYTALYHSLIDPRTMSDVNGNYPGGDGMPQQAKTYTKRTIFSGWDVYRSQFPLLTLVAPNVIDDEINSVIDLATQNGKKFFDRWELMNAYTGCMSGSPQVVVINDAYQKGIRNYDLAKAYEYSLNTCEKFGNGPVAQFNEKGRDVAVTLQNVFADWNMAQLAAALGHADVAKNFAARGGAYRLLFDADAPWTYDKLGKDARPEWKGWVRSKEVGGAWKPWLGLLPSPGGMESTIYQEGWFFPQDVPGLIQLLGGKDVFVAKLSDFFERAPNLAKWSGYMNISNEPSHLIPFLFNRAGAPWLTQKWVRRLVTETYGSAPNALSGDDDVGQMSAWFVLAASGLAQACPGDPRFEIFTPLFDRVSYRLDPKYAKGRSFVVTAKNNSPENVYIQSAALNGRPLNRCWINYSEITAGGTLDLVLGPQPNRKWGVE